MEHSEHAVASPEITFAHEPAKDTKRIWKTFWILLVITMIELACGLTIYTIHKNPDFSYSTVLFIKGAVVILSLAKAFFIVSVFMHLGDEIRNLVLTIVVPLLLFLWFIGAFLWDGNSWRKLRNEFNREVPGQTQPAKPEVKKPGALD